MARSVDAWQGKTDDTPVPPRVRLRVWDREAGKCHRCRRDIPVGDAWIIEHRHALVLGGPNAEPNLCLTCSWCKPLKDAEDQAAKSETARVRSKHLGIQPQPSMRSQGFRKAGPQNKATKPRTPKFEGDIMARRTT
ncbi:MAG: HNH endonuclease [Devosia sp.]|uniref:HNH endonuclease n=1 Tax=Devosia sp. TaxID=1871048 RepID=UPI0033918DF5